MDPYWVFNKCDEAVKTTLRSYWTQKWPRLEKLIDPHIEDFIDVRLTVTCHEQSPIRLWYDVHAVINLHSGTLAADAEDKNPTKMLDLAVDQLVEELKRHRERVRKDYVFKRKTRPHDAISAAGPQPPANRQRRKDFFDILRPLLPQLQERARHEIRLLTEEGLLHRRELSVSDLLDETLRQAWERFEDRPRNVPVEKWLSDVLDDVLEQWIKQQPHPHDEIDEGVRENPPAEAIQVDDQEWWAWLLGYDDTTTLDELIPGFDGNEIWDQLDVAEQRKQIWELVNELPERQRQAFTLFAVDGLAPFEIAMIQDRSESEVKADIEAARHTLQARLRERGMGRSERPVEAVPAP